MTHEEAIALRIIYLMIEKGIGRKELADLMHVQPSIITRWLSGTHNFTIETIAKIEAVLNAEILKISTNDPTR